nr:MAG TPA: hypothetical protein [Caudoviricetes sp.]
MIQPKHYNYHNQSGPPKCVRTTLTTSGVKNR